MLKVCVNGARLPAEHDRLSADPAAVGEEARGAVAAGADAVHVHPKSADGSDSLVGGDVDRFVAALRSACPGTEIGVTTGAWATADVSERLATIESWTLLPDFASVNWHEAGADDVAELLIARGIGVEAGIWDSAGLAAWSVSRFRGRCLRVLVEIQPDVALESVEPMAAALIAGVREQVPEARILLHGEGSVTWPAYDLAAEWGLDSRIGLEDTLTLPDGRVAESNAALVTEALVRRQRFCDEDSRS